MEKSRTVQSMNTPKYDFLSSQASRGLTIHSRRKPTGIAGINPNTVVIGHDVPEHDAFDLDHRHLFRLNFVEFFLFQRGEKAFHSGVIVAAPSSAHALDGAMPGQSVSECSAGELAAPVAVEDHTIGRL